MEAIRIYREALDRRSNRAAGLHYRQPARVVANQQQARHEHEIMSYPVDSTRQASLQVLDAGDDYGKFWFLPGYSIPDGPDIIHP